MAGRKKPYISLGGQITLIKATWANIPVCYMSLLFMPGKVRTKIERIQGDLLWEGGKGRKDHLVKWEDTCRPIEYNGLGLGHVKERNFSLQGNGCEICNGKR